MSIPEAIRQQRPTQFGAVEIRDFGGHYYVYQVSSKWDPNKKRPQKITGKSIGKITEKDGFIENANGMRVLRDMRIMPDVAPFVRNYGAYETMRQLSPNIEEKLRIRLPDVFREVRTLSLLRLIDGASSARMMQPLFLDSYMSDLCPDLAMSEGSVRRFICELGRRQSDLDAFMRDFILPGSMLLFDGTSIFWNSSDSLSEKGYNPNHRLDPQVRILYVFENNTHRPVFYRIVQGSVVDKTAFIDTVEAAGCKDCTIITDKGFYSKKNLSALMAAHMKFIIPLQDNTTSVEPEFYTNNDTNKWDGAFPFKSRMVWFRKRPSGNRGNFIYTYCDDLRKTQLQANLAEQVEKDYTEQDLALMDVMKERPRMGYFSFCSNLDWTAKKIYLAYKDRWDIEQCFDYLKNSVSKSASHARSDDYLRGWAFLNHVSLLYYYGLINTLRQAELNEKYSPEDVIKLTKNIYRVDSGDNRGYRVSAIRQKTQSLLDQLGVELLREN